MHFLQSKLSIFWLKFQRSQWGRLNQKIPSCQYRDSHDKMSHDRLVFNSSPPPLDKMAAIFADDIFKYIFVNE